jgi:hypothetical protein
MARIRTIKPEFWKHELLSELPESTHMLAAALINYSDDEGYFNANPKLIKAECFPLREPSVSVPESLRSLQAIGYLEFGTGNDGRRYGRIVKFDEHQRVSHPTPSKIKDCVTLWDDSGISPEDSRKIPEDSAPERKGKERNREGKGKEESEAAPQPSRSSKKIFDSLPIPPELDNPEAREALDRWENHRKQIKKPLTPEQAIAQLKQLAIRGSPSAIAMIDHTIFKGWQGLREDDSSGKPASNGRSLSEIGPQ